MQLGGRGSRLVRMRWVDMGPVSTADSPSSSPTISLGGWYIPRKRPLHTILTAMTARGKELITHLGVMNRDIQLQVFKYSLRFFSAANQPPLSQARRFSAQNLDRHIHASTLRCRRRERPLPHQRPRSQRFKVNCLYTAVVP